MEHNVFPRPRKNTTCDIAAAIEVTTSLNLGFIYFHSLKPICFLHGSDVKFNREMLRATTSISFRGALMSAVLPNDVIFLLISYLGDQLQKLPLGVTFSDNA